MTEEFKQRLPRISSALAVCLCLLGMAAAPGGADAQLVIEINRGSVEPAPIAVVPFGWEGSGDAPFDLAAVVQADLERSGRFQGLDRNDMTQKPTRGTDVNFRDWRLLDVESVLIGRLLPRQGDQYEIQFQLFDVYGGKQLLGFRMDAAGGSLRRAAHRIADMVYKSLTGIPGAFDTRIAYVVVNVTGDGKRHQLIVADADGENEAVVAESPQPIMSPAWSPDGRQLAYVSFEGGESAVYIQTLRTGSRQKVSSRAGVNGAPMFSPDGKRLALTLSRDGGNLDVYTLELATQVLTRLTDAPAIDTEPAWSPDGQYIYFTSDRSGGPQVYRTAANGRGRPERITFEGRYNARPRISPDGKSLAVVHLDRGNYRIALIDLDNQTTQVLTEGSLDESPSFAPNGATLIYATRDRGEGVLATVSSDGRIRQELKSREGQVQEPVWSPFLGP